MKKKWLVKWFAKKQWRNKSTENKRLALLAQELGTAMLMILINDYDFSKEQANDALGKVLEQAKENRTAAVLANYDVLNKNEDG